MKFKKSIKDWWKYSSLKTKLIFILLSYTIFLISDQLMIIDFLIWLIGSVIMIFIFVCINMYFFKKDIEKIKRSKHDKILQ